VLLRPEFAAEPRRVPHEPPAVLVTMGGSDPARLTLRAMRALAHVNGPIHCVVLLGPGFCHDGQLAPLLETCPHESLIVRDGDVRANMLAADLAVLSFGVTAYEAAACALPAVHLCLTDDHALSSSVFPQAGVAVSLGLAEDVEEARLVEVVEGMLADHEGRGAMGVRARCLVDGNGAARIAEVIATRRSG
jgi:spore coat polysaccharide biosynthesis protein SpsF